MLSGFQFIRASLLHHWRIHLSVGLAVVVATAVLTGALVVGDSVRGSLRHLALDRLGNIEVALVADRFFRTKLADELKAEPAFSERFSDALPAILIPGTLETTAETGKSRAGNVNVLGIDAMFWSLGDRPLAKALLDSQVVLNQALADQLSAKVGDEIILRVGQTNQIPADSPLGRKNDSIRNRRLTVEEIIPTEGLGRFGLRPNQQLPLNAFVTIAAAQEMLDQPDKCNAIFAAGRVDPLQGHEGNELGDLLKPTLEDLGLRVTESPVGYFNLSSTRMLLDAGIEGPIRDALKQDRIETALTYLANYIKVDGGKGKLPYSTITAIDEVPGIGPLADDEIVLNRWAADDLEKQGTPVKPGDLVEIEYFEPESTHGEVREQKATFTLKGVAEMTPEIADRNFTPELPGVTDQQSIANWDPPFPYDDTRVRSRKPHDEDEAYWDEYKATPKAFISLTRGRKLWSSRFGNATSLRIWPAGDVTAEQLAPTILNAVKPEQLGFQFLPVRSWALQASSGTTPFNLLFIGFSFFIVAAAMMLIAILFRLGIDERASQIGVLSAVGLRSRRVLELLLMEGLVVSIVAGLIGAMLGVGYAWLMLVGLQTWWLDAIRSPFLRLFVSPLTLGVGYSIGILVATGTIAWTLWRMRSLSVRRLLHGEVDAENVTVGRSSARGRWIAVALGAIALALGFTGTFAIGKQSQMMASGMFFGAGAAALAAVLTYMGVRLRSTGSKSLLDGQHISVARLAMRNAARNPRRSLHSMGLIASATFLIIAISAFRLDPAKERAGAGGFQLMAESSQPIYRDLGTREGRAELGFSDKDDKTLADAKVFSFRVQPGDDASCLNLYQTTQPRAVGIPSALLERGGFAWAGFVGASEATESNPWSLLALPPIYEVPIVLDANTAMYSLHKKLYDTLDLIDGRSQPFKANIVGLLQNSIFQGDMLMSEANLLRHFPDVNGYRMFLIETPNDVNQVQNILETTLGDYGFDAERTEDRLANFFAVQNTYLSTFQSLGGLGLLLGTFGLAAVQMRSVLERRGELALLRAVGFDRGKLARLVILENVVLLCGGLLIGSVAALIGVMPHWLSGSASLPWLSLVATLLLVLATGLAAGMLAVRAALKAPILAALRGD